MLAWTSNPATGAPLDELLWVAGGLLLTLLIVIAVSIWSVQEFRENRRRREELYRAPPAACVARPVSGEPMPSDDADAR